MVPDPNADQLVEIAHATARTWHALFGPSLPARLGFLSYSTKGSALGGSPGKVREACEKFKAKYPEVLCDGEMQFDAAVSNAVSMKKMGTSPVGGQVNCFIFPNLDAGNIGYKLAQRWGGCEAFGPLIQGLKKPYSDLSRGASWTDVLHSVLLDILRS